MILTRNEARNYLANAGFEGVDLNKAVLIAECESGFDTNAHNINFEDSRGLMQINLEAHPYYSSLDLFDPELNTLIAYELYTIAGNSFQDWTCANTLGLIGAEIPLYLALAFGIGIVLYSLS